MTGLDSGRCLLPNVYETSQFCPPDFFLVYATPSSSSCQVAATTCLARLADARGGPYVLLLFLIM